MASEVVYGINAVKSMLTHRSELLIEVFIQTSKKDQRLVQLIEQLQHTGVSMQFLHKHTLDKLATDRLHQGIVARIITNKSLTEIDLIPLIKNNKNILLLVLDEVTDPHNLGACLRSADAAGVTAVIIPKHRSAQLNGTVRKVACGAAETVPLVRVTNLVNCLRALKEQNITVLGLSEQSKKLFYQQQLNNSLALVMGAEGKGLRRLTKEHCQQIVSLPMAGSVSTLNVAVAAGVALFEVIRQRQYLN